MALENVAHYCTTTRSPCVTGLDVTLGNSSSSAGFEKIPVDLNAGAGGEYVYLWKIISTEGNCLSEIRLWHAENDTSDPFGAGWNRSQIDLNDGAGHDFVYIGWKSDPGGTPIHDVRVNSNVDGGAAATLPDSTWHVAQWTDGSNADANVSIRRSNYVYVLYQQ